MLLLAFLLHVPEGLFLFLRRVCDFSEDLLVAPDGVADSCISALLSLITHLFPAVLQLLDSRLRNLEFFLESVNGLLDDSGKLAQLLDILCRIHDSFGLFEDVKVVELGLCLRIDLLRLIRKL